MMRHACPRSLLLLLGCCAALAAQSLVAARNLADGSLYSDQVARQIGDLVTIRIEESTRVTDSQETDTSRKNDIAAQVEMFPNSNKIPAVRGQENFGTLPAAEAESSKAFSGEGSYAATGRVQAMITARVVDVLDNGNLLLEGRRQLVIQNETKTILLMGICRTADLSADNMVLSNRLHNFQVSIEGKGPLSRAQQEGLVGRVIDILWPL